MKSALASSDVTLGHLISPFTPKSDLFHISPAALPEILASFRSDYDYEYEI